MHNALLLSSINLSRSLNRLSGKQKPVSKSALLEMNHVIIDWYGTFTDVPQKTLKQVSRQINTTSKEKLKRSPQNKRLHSAVLSAIDFLFAYMEPLELINMVQYGADKKKQKALSKMVAKLAAFHKKELHSLKWLREWLDDVDPLFPTTAMHNKLACCFSDVKTKPCFEIRQSCHFESQLDWIKTPVGNAGGILNQDDCCQGSTLSSCSGGTLYCPCVAGNSGCDCQAPNKLCSKNDHGISELIPGFSDPQCMMLTPNPNPDSGGGGGTIKQPPCPLFDPVGFSGCMLDEVIDFNRGRSSMSLDPARGRFILPEGTQFDLGRVINLAKDCQQTGFCPPQSSGCPGLA
ncbi:MAG: hypothetical protein ABW185_29110 [Sedimenticola sp.]